jgi:hypothetical protein
MILSKRVREFDPDQSDVQREYERQHLKVNVSFPSFRN